MTTTPTTEKKKLPKVGEHFDKGYHVARIWEHEEWWDLDLMNNGERGFFRALKTEWERETPHHNPSEWEEDLHKVLLTLDFPKIVIFVDTLIKQTLTQREDYLRGEIEKYEELKEWAEGIVEGTAFSGETGLIWQHWLDEGKRILSLLTKS